MMTRNSLNLSKDYEQEEDKIVKTVLDKNEGFLKRHLVLSSSVVGKLITTGVLNDTAHTKMRGESNEIQVSILLNVLRRSGINILKKFIEVLRTSMDSWVADVILDTNIADTVLVGKKYTLTEHLKKSADNYDSNIPSNGSKRPTSDMMATFRNINYRGHSMISSQQLNRISAMYDNERQNHESALAILRQEEETLRELLNQNLQEQAQIRRNQRSLYDIDKKLKQISMETSQLSATGSRSNKARERLLQLQRIPRPKAVAHDSSNFR